MNNNFVRNRVVLLCIALSAVLVSCYYAGPRMAGSGRRPPLYGRRILLDPGHGVKNSEGKFINRGMPGPDGIWEDEIVVDIAELLGRKLTAAGCEVHYTRTTEQFWRIYDDVRGDNYNRSFEARDLNVDACLKIHTDWYKNKKISGTRTFFFKKDSALLAKYLHRNLVRFIRRKNRGLHREWFLGMEVAAVPTVLVEVCFLSNPEEAALLKNQVFLDLCAEGLFQGMINYFEKENPPLRPPPQVNRINLVRTYGKKISRTFGATILKPYRAMFSHQAHTEA